MLIVRECVKKYDDESGRGQRAEEEEEEEEAYKGSAEAEPQLWRHVVRLRFGVR